MTINPPVSQPDEAGEAPELLPCPLVHPVEKGLNISSSSGMRKWRLTCFDCGLYFEGMLDETARALFKRWNTRAPSPDPIAEKAERLAAQIVGRERLDYNWVRDIVTAEFGGGVGGDSGHNDR